MNKEEIINIVSKVTGISYEGMKLSRPVSVLFAKYAAIIMMHEEGYSAIEIGEALKTHRTNIHSAIRVINDLLETNRTFKNTYLACIAKVSEMEDAA
jgi:hypothetical protein